MSYTLFLFLAVHNNTAILALVLQISVTHLNIAQV